MKLIVRRLLAVAMALLFPLSAISADMHGAMLHVTKTGTVNGTGITRPTAILEGDKLQIPSDSSGSIAMSGTSVVIAPGSTLTYSNKFLELANISGVAVSTTVGTAVKIDKLTIAPARATGKYHVARAGGEVLIAAKTGPVNIFDGTSTRTIAEGSTETVPDPAPAPQRSARGGSVAAVVAGLAVALAAALIAIETTGEKTPISGVRP
jgi:hypothetical protein